MIAIRLPQFGMGMSDGTIIKWHKREGEYVAKGEPLCDIEAAKTTVEYESPASGVLRIIVPLDTNVACDTVIAEIDETATAAAPGADDTAVALRQDADLPPVAETSPATADAARATPLARREAEQNGVDLAGVNGSGPRGKIMRRDVTPAPAPQQIEPRARRAARERGIDLSTVTGTGPGGRITEEDVIATAESAASKPIVRAADPTPSPAPAPPLTDGVTEVPHSMMRRTIARRLTESKSTIPHFYIKGSCRIDRLLALRKELNAVAGEKISVNDLIVRGVALALCEVPDANVQFDEKVMRRYKGVDVAVAVATPRGLVTPIVRQVQSKTIRQVAAEVKELAGRAKEGKLKPEEYSGGQTSVSNLGMFGVEEFSAILNPPQSSIFAIGAGQEQIIPVDGKPEIATMMTITASFDHRAIDGAVGAQLMAALKNLMETPSRLLA